MGRGGALRTVEVGSHVGDAPDVFRPERFLDDDPDRPEYAYVPFGGGPRHCIGMRVARLEFRLAVATLCRRYRLEAITKDLDLVASANARPSHPVEVRVRARGAVNDDLTPDAQVPE